MTIHLEIPEQQAAALKAKAMAKGITLETLFRELLTHEAPSENDVQGKRAAASTILELQQHVKPDPEGWTVRDYINYGRR